MNNKKLNNSNLEENKQNELGQAMPNDKSSSLNRSDKNSDKQTTISVPQINLPKGGGAIKGIQEKFEVNAVNGTSSLSVPLPISQSRQGFQPQLALSYNSGSGNSPFGLGWNLGIPSISRQTNKKLPEYKDYEDSDVFVLSGAEDLIPVIKRNDEGIWEKVTKSQSEKDVIDDIIYEYQVSSYIPRIEGLFAKIEKWKNLKTGKVHWRSISRDNVKSFYGYTQECQIADPNNQDRIFQWLLSHSFDDKGNLIIYKYKQEDFKNVPTNLFEKNKIDNSTNLYLKRIVYGNKVPYMYGDLLPVEDQYKNEFMFHTQFDYGEHDLKNPVNVYEEKKKGWTYRKDAFSSFRSCFDIRTYRRCKRVLQFHCFDELIPKPYLVKSMEFVYSDSLELLSTKDTINGFSFLNKIIQKGHKINKTGDAFNKRELPAMEFKYQQHEWNNKIEKISKENIENMPIGIDGSEYQWTDLFSEGIPGILTEQGSAWYYMQNLGEGKFSPHKQISPKPSISGLRSGEVQLQDLEGNGQKHLISYNSNLPGHFLIDEEDSWQPMQNFDLLPNLNLNDPNSKFMDLNGDGKSDLLVSEDEVFWWYPSMGKKGFKKAISIRKPRDEEEGPALVFADSTQSIFLADIIGDGLTDIVRIRNGEVCFWANMGYGMFSKKVSMDKSPWFDFPEKFNPAYIRLSDIDGSGTTDIIYLGKDKFQVWLNKNGNEFSEEPKVIDPFFKIDKLVNVQVMDFLGTGTSCIVYSSPHQVDSQKPLQYINLMGSRKPHLMTEIKNNFGKKTLLSYCSSTRFYLEDKKEGNPWITKLPFPVHVLEKTETRDEISGTLFVRSYSYHHGYYDYIEKEFRGFGRVEQKDTEEYEHFIRNKSLNALENKKLHQAPVFTKTWFHTGAYIQKSKILDQFKTEYYQNPDEHQLPDAEIQYIEPDNPHVSVVIEAHRACKSMLLRKEIYSCDENNSQRDFPYVVEEHNCYVKQLQEKGINKHAIFLVLESEAITYQYEQDADDPRIAHTLNIEIDNIGNVLKAISVVYPRKKEPDIPQYVENTDNDRIRNEVLKVQKGLLISEQQKWFISYSENEFTNDKPDTENDIEWNYRLRLPSQTKLFEITTLAKTGNYFNLQEVRNEIGTTNKKLLQHQRNIYMKNDLSGPLLLGEMESLGLPYETYILAYNETLKTDNYEGRVSDGDLLKAQYRLSNDLKTGNNKIFPDTDNDNEWWIPSGKAGYSSKPIAINNFYQPDIFKDPFENVSKVIYVNNGLFIAKNTDAIGNSNEIKSIDYRHLAPKEIEDPNKNISEVRFNMLGLVAGIAVKGKDEADNFIGFNDDPSPDDIKDFFTDPVTNGRILLKNATTRFIYDFNVRLNEDEDEDDNSLPPKPLAVATIIREEHTAQNISPKLQFAFEYSGGLGQAIMQKVQAQPGDAWFINPSGEREKKHTGESLRWIGNGRTIINNKGNPVKQFEPYFSTTHKYEDDKRLVEIGYSPILYYDAIGRLIKTENPDGTFNKVEFDAWQQRSFDANDMVEESDWYKRRTEGDLKDDANEKNAAIKAATHNNTPSLIFLDALGRAIYTIEHNKEKDFTTGTYSETYYGTFIKLDLENQQEYIQAAQGATIIDYKYDLAGNPCYQNSKDAGKKWTFTDVMGNPVYSWDANGNCIETEYDELRRPKEFIAHTPDGNSIVFEKTEYGDWKHMTDAERTTSQQNNLIGQAVKIFDSAGKTEIKKYDFKGNPLETLRKICEKYESKPNWNLDIAFLEDDFITKNKYDALNRITLSKTPDKSTHKPLYNESGQLHEIWVDIPGNYAATEKSEKQFVKKIYYNAKGQREKIIYGNNTSTKYSYDEKNYRLIHLNTIRKDDEDNPLQDLYYTYDPVGNITHIFDNAQQTIFFDNTEVKPIGEYEYDALYRLIQAEGREHAANNNKQVSNLDMPYHTGIPHANDKETLRNYTQRYTYDELGNIMSMKHKVKNGTDCWKRFYHYKQIQEGSNRLTSTSIGSEPYNPEGYPNDYNYDANGNMLCMPHLPMRQGEAPGEENPSLTWDLENQLQEVDLGNGDRAYYSYDSQGQRVRKTVIKSGNRQERIYLGNTEIYREFSGKKVKKLERWTLSISDDTGTIAQTDTKTFDKNPIDGTETDTINPLNTPLFRFQYSNHLGTATIEADMQATVISYEEYHPYGTSAYRSSKSDVNFSLKRYRYTGKERDEETGLYYYGARYYLPWLGRWCSCDPILIANEAAYVFVRNRPILLIDQKGKTPKEKEEYTSSFNNELNIIETNISDNIRYLHEEVWQLEDELAEEQMNLDNLEAFHHKLIREENTIFLASLELQNKIEEGKNDVIQDFGFLGAGLVALCFSAPIEVALALSIGNIVMDEIGGADGADIQDYTLEVANVTGSVTQKVTSKASTKAIGEMAGPIADIADIYFDYSGLQESQLSLDEIHNRLEQIDYQKGVIQDMIESQKYEVYKKENLLRDAKADLENAIDSVIENWRQNGGNVRKSPNWVFMNRPR